MEKSKGLSSQVRTVFKDKPFLAACVLGIVYFLFTMMPHVVVMSGLGDKLESFGVAFYGVFLVYVLLTLPAIAFAVTFKNMNPYLALGLNAVVYILTAYACIKLEMMWKNKALTRKEK